MKYATQAFGAPLAFAFALGVGMLSGDAAPVEAQFSFEGRGSLQYPVGDFDDIADSEAGLGVDVFYNLSRSLSVYGGYGIEQFGCDGCDDDGISQSGFEAGAKFLFDRESGVLPWARVGAVVRELEFETGPVTATSDTGVGLQASVGLDIPLGEILSFSPAIRYEAWSADFGPLDALDAEQDVRFLSLDLGVHVHPHR